VVGVAVGVVVDVGVIEHPIMVKSVARQTIRIDNNLIFISGIFLLDRSDILARAVSLFNETISEEGVIIEQTWGRTEHHRKLHVLISAAIREHKLAGQNLLLA
jgi:hypothetical protein